MQEIKLNIEEPYVNSFLEHLKSFKYIEVKAVSRKKDKQQKLSATEAFLKTTNPSDALVKAVKPSNNIVSLEEIIKKQGYKGIDRKRFDALVAQLDFNEPTINEILEQLTP